ncbi:T9SS type A sorting domain-containing protein [Winogradskyella ludwigii]|uniref:T9SS type A sorting domain-containing protein n=1 Tax=Winogradskyella ludwigii TaxID=2686076 RepID=UPI0015CCC5B7|nr:T9SS type A sorting domain-containing protein [Winogradskyella ludwigii]
MKTKLLLLLAVCSFLNIQAQLCTTSFSQGTSSLSPNYSCGQGYIAQCDGTLEYVQFLAASAGTIPAGTLKIFSGNQVSGSPIYTQSHPAITVSQANDPIRVDITGVVNMVNNVQYTFEITINNVDILFDFAGGYSGGTFFQSDNGIIIEQPNFDLNFDVSILEPCTVNILDTNFKSYLVSNIAINTDSDTEISCAEATAFTGAINVSNQSISNLVGLEAFTNITQLNCSYNSLTSLDLANNIVLELLNCQNNSLEILNVANGNNTAITSFTARNNPDLTCIQVDDVAYINSVNFFYIDNGVASFSTNCNFCYVTIPDANLKAALLANTAINTNIDSEISYTEALAFTGILDVQNQSISDLTGIEAFTNITGLFCNNNALTSLDITSNTSLIALRCLNNSLTSLNVANGNNANIVQFNTLNNPNLTCIQVDAGFTPPPTAWQKDGVANYSDNCYVAPCIVNIPDANFKTILVADTAINTNGNAEIECSEASNFTGSINCANSSISDLTGIETFTALKWLYCFNNTISSIDVSQNVALITLSCGDNTLSSLDVSQNPDLLILGCANNVLTSLNVANGNNANTIDAYFEATGNSNLICIQVDDATYSTNNWTNIDTQTSFSTNCSLSVNDFNLNSISLHPNPTSSMLNIEMTQNIKQATVYSMLGKEVLKTQNKQIDVSRLSNGVFLIKIEDENGNVSTKRFVKQ